MLTPVLDADVNKQFLKKLIGVSGSGLDLTKIQKALQNNKGIKLKIDKNMPDAKKYIKFLTPSQINKIISSRNPVEISFSNTQLRKMMQEGGFFGAFAGPIFSSIFRTAVPAIAKNVVAPLAVQAASSAVDAGIQKAIMGSGIQNINNKKKFKLCINSNELREILQAIAALEKSGELVEGITETVADSVQRQEGGILGFLISSLAASMIGSLLSKGSGGVRAGEMVGEGYVYNKNRIGVRPR